MFPKIVRNSRLFSKNAVQHLQFQLQPCLLLQRNFSGNKLPTSNPDWESWNSWNKTNFAYPIPSKVKIVEVGCRDGIQNESNDYIVPIDTKFNLLSKLSETGIYNMEGGAFVHPKWIPQMATSDKIFEKINSDLKEKNKSITYSALVPNVKGLEKAINYGINEVIMITAASESFNKKNTNCTIKESLDRCKEVIDMAHENNIRVRTAISCSLGCPYEGNIDRNVVCDIVDTLDDMNCDEIAIADTIGIGTPGNTYKLMNDVSNRMNKKYNNSFNFMGTKVAGHFHNTYGQALNNILTSLAFGISIFDCSVAGLGGCPYAKGATGNVPTEDVVFMLQSLGIDTGIDLNKLIDVSEWITKQLSKTKNESKVSTAVINKRS